MLFLLHLQALYNIYFWLKLKSTVALEGLDQLCLALTFFFPVFFHLKQPVVEIKSLGGTECVLCTCLFFLLCEISVGAIKEVLPSKTSDLLRCRGQRLF